MSDAARDREKQIKNAAKAAGKKGGQRVGRNYKANLCRHADNPGDCSKCIGEARALRNDHTRNVNRAKRVKKIKKKNQKKGCGKKAAVILVFVLSALGSLGWGAVELVRLVI